MERARERKSVPPRMLKYSSKIGIAAALLFAASMWFYMQRVLITHQEAEAATHDIPRGNLSDLYPRWLGARELLLRHRDPYSPEITREIQIGYYGRALDSHRAYDPIDQQAFAYPVYVVFLLAPAVFLPFWMVQIGARWFLAVLTAATVLFALRALRWRQQGLRLCNLRVAHAVYRGKKLKEIEASHAHCITPSVTALGLGSSTRISAGRGTGAVGLATGR